MLVNVLCCTIMVLLVAVDQLTKIFMQMWLADGAKAFIPHVLQFNYAENTGMAFSLLQDARWIFITVTIVVCIGLVVVLLKRKLKNPLACTAIVLIVSGGVGNLIDRIFRGYVIDFIEPVFINFAIFNFADCLVSVGAVLLGIYLVWDIVKDVRAEKQKKVQGNGE